MDEDISLAYLENRNKKLLWKSILREATSFVETKRFHCNLEFAYSLTHPIVRLCFVMFFRELRLAGGLVL